MGEKPAVTEARRRAEAQAEQLVPLNYAEELIWQAAGLGASAVMEKAPTVEMPTAEIAEGMKKLLAEIRGEVADGRV